MESLLRDIKREHERMQEDVRELERHYGKLETFLQQYLEQAVSEWARLVVDHPRALLLIVETTSILGEDGYATSGQQEPIRFTTMLPATGEVWDQLLRPTYSRTVRGAQYHGIEMVDLVDKPSLVEAWPQIEQRLVDRHLIVFGADWARGALRTVLPGAQVLNGAACLHNKAKEYYQEFYDLSLEKVLSYQGLEVRREDVCSSRDRLPLLAMVVRNLAAGMPKQEQEPEPSDSFDLDKLDEHPF